MSTAYAETTVAPIIRMSALKAYVGLCPATIYQWMSRGEFPHPLRLGRNAVGWRVAEIDAWLASREQGVSNSARHEAKKKKTELETRAKDAASA